MVLTAPLKKANRQCSNYGDGKVEEVDQRELSSFHVQIHFEHPFCRPLDYMIVCVGRTGLFLVLKEEERKEMSVLKPRRVATFPLTLTKCFTSFVSYVRSTT